MEKIFTEKEHTPQALLFNKTGRMYHIDGMKGILCFMVMLGHFWNIYRNCQEHFEFKSYYLNLIRGTFLDNPLLVASFWLYAFLVISGYLLSVTKIRSLTELVKKAAKRFLRFFLPILGACLFIYILQETVGFYTEKTTAYFTNNWYQEYYRTDSRWTEIFTESIRAMTAAACKFNSPFWVIRDMFLSSLVIYICNYVDYGRDQKNNILPVLCFLNVVYVDRPVIIACLAGYLLGYYREQVVKLTKRKVLFIFVVVATVSFVKLMMSRGIMPKVFDNIFLYILIWCAFVIFVNQSAFLIKFFSSKLFLQMGKISFGVYAFHWPVICSVGSYVLVKGLENGWRVLVVFGSSLLVSILCTVVLSVIYFFAVEKTSDKILRFL